MFLFARYRRNKTKQITPASDEELVSMYRYSGDPDILGELFIRYTHLLFGVCLKYFKDEERSKDAVMQVFEELGAKLTENEVRNFKSWIYTVTKNFCLMALRREKSEEKQLAGYFEQTVYENMESADFLHLITKTDGNDRIEQLKNGMEQLHEHQRICLELIYLQNKSYEETAAITGYSMKQVKSYIQNGKRNLKNILTPQ
jgi:RNA polymerase sigma factor (sigma-70 family)